MDGDYSDYLGICKHLQQEMTRGESNQASLMIKSRPMWGIRK